MSPQYRSDTDRPLYEAVSGNPQNDCCCDEGVDTHKYDACCDNATYDELPTYPHYVVISDVKFTALGDPDCVIYNGCCYCGNITSSGKSVNVTESEVTASVDTNCSNCQATEEGNCATCVVCNDCDPRLEPTYDVSFDAELLDIYVGAIADAMQIALDAGVTVTNEDDTCNWRYSEIIPVGGSNLLWAVLVHWLEYSAGLYRWDMTITFAVFPGLAVGDKFSASVAECQPDDTYTLYTFGDAGSFLKDGATAVVS